MEHIQTDKSMPTTRGLEGSGGGRKVGAEGRWWEYQVMEKANKDSKPENQEVIPTSPI